MRIPSIIRTLTPLLCLALTGALFAGTPHTAYGTLEYSDGSVPVSVTFSAYIVGRSSDILTQASIGCFYSNGSWSVQAGNFSTSWSPWERLHVDFNDGQGMQGSIEVTLSTEASDDAGRTIITSGNHNIKLNIPDTSVRRGDNVLIPIRLEGMSVADSVIAYEIIINYDADVLASLNASSQGTMTQNWGEPYAAPRVNRMAIGGFTSNTTGSRLVSDGGILVNARFLAQGLPSSQTSANTLIRFQRAIIYTLSTTHIISATKLGAIRITSDGTHVNRAITLYPYWNLICLAVSPQPNTLPEAIEGVDVSYIYGYRGGDGPMSWDVNRPDFLNDLTVLNGLYGYWFKSTAQTNQTWNVDGVAVQAATPLVLYKDWNLVGYLPSLADELSHALTSLGTSYTNVVGYEGSGGGVVDWDRARPDFLNTLTHLQTFHGYWIKMDEAAALQYPTSGQTGTAAGFPAAAKPGAVMGTYNTPPAFCDFWALQPGVLQPGDTVKAYDEDGVLCGDTLVVSQGGFQIHVLGDDETTSYVDEGAVEGDTIRFTVGGLEARVVAGDPTWEPGVSKQVTLDFGSSGIGDEHRTGPRSFQLGNYPNPFNSTTTICYQLERQSIITVKIVDLRGRLVTTLVDGRQQEPGTWRVEWNGRDVRGMSVGSGVYFCRLRAGEEIITRKMILLN